MCHRIGLTAVLMLSCAFVARLGATEYFVSKQGDDANDGASREAAFLTIQRGVDALQPGDTLTIGPGEYREAVTREDLGSQKADTTIRAEIPGTVLLRGDVPAPEFSKVEGHRFLYVGDFGQEATAVNEVDTLRILESAPNMQEVEFSPGTFYQDLEAGKIYISTSDMQPPDGHDYTVCVLKGRGGVHLLRPQRVVLEGVAATGYNTTVRMPRLRHGNSASDCIPWGLFMSNPRRCVIRDCTAFLNAGGIAIQSGAAGENVVEGCVGYGNSSTHSSEGGNIIVFNTNDDNLLNSYAYVGEGHGMRLYTGGTDPEGLMQYCLGWGHHKLDFHVKAGNLAEAHNCVGVDDGGTTNGKVYDSLSGKPMGVPGDQNNIILSEANNLDMDSEFADPYNLDFRLQSASRFRGDGPEGRDRGPYPYEPVVHYVKPDGSDTGDGLSIATAWRTLSRAFEALEPGDTLYLAGGEYAGNLTLTAGEAGGEAIHIRGRGTDPAMIRGDLDVANSQGVVFQRLNFNGGAAARDSGDIRFQNCAFAAGPLEAEAVEGLRVEHCVFPATGRTAVSLRGSDSVLMRGNVFNNAQAPAVDTDRAEAILYSDYNAYAQDSGAWRVGTQARGLGQLGGHEVHAAVRAPEFSTENNAPALDNPRDFQTGGPLGTSLGVYVERRRYDTTSLRVAGPFLHSTTDTTANFEWWSSRRAIFEVRWGETPACENSETLTPATAFHPGSPLRPYNTYSLTGLKPNTKYYFRVQNAWMHDSPSVMADVPDPYRETVAFTTATEPRPARAYYVATNGDDANDGLSRASAWRTINHAASQVRPGDTVLIGGGEYREHVRPRATGEEGRPITFRAAPGEKVRLDGANKTLVAAFSISNKKNIAIDGLYFGNHQRHNTIGLIRVSRVDGLRVTRCFQDGRGAGYDPEFLTAGQSRDLLVENCVTISGWDGMATGRTDNVRVRHCVLVRPLIRSICISGGEDILIDSNIITDNLVRKSGAWLLAGSAYNDARIVNNCFFLRVPESERPVFGRARGRLAGYEEEAGLEGSNLIANPQFALVKENEELAEQEYFSEAFMSPIKDFPDLFATNPELVEREIGLQPEAFEDFHFNQD